MTICAVIRTARTAIAMSTIRIQILQEQITTIQADTATRAAAMAEDAIITATAADIMDADAIKLYITVYPKCVLWLPAG